jgi:flagellar assembly protein FliH
MRKTTSSPEPQSRESLWAPPEIEDDRAYSLGGYPKESMLELPELPDDAIDPAHARSGAGARRAEANLAYDKGYADGQREAASVAQQKIGTAVAALCHAADALTTARRELPRTMSSDLHALAIVIAKKIVLREIESDPEIVKSRIAHAFGLIPPDAPVEIRLNPDDLAAVQTEIERTVSGDDGAYRVQCVADPSIERGGFILEGAQRILDGRIDVALRALFERLESE